MKMCYFCKSEMLENEWFCSQCGQYRGETSDASVLQNSEFTEDTIAICPECLFEITSENEIVACKKCGAQYHAHCFASVSECIAPECIGERETASGYREKAEELESSYCSESNAEDSYDVKGFEHSKEQKDIITLVVEEHYRWQMQMVILFFKIAPPILILFLLYKYFTE